MKILVTSDTHNDFKALNKAVDDNPMAKLIIHLGDGLNDIKKIKKAYRDKIILAVKGNCDLNLNVPLMISYSIKKKRLFLTHGNLFNVKKDLSYIINHALENNFNILLFGHTHIPHIENKDGLMVMNPGSLKTQGGTYGILEILNKKINGDIFKI